jgi:hypothetical protein
MKILKTGDKGMKDTKIDVSAKIATCIHQSTHESLVKGSRFQLTWNVDLSNLTDEEMLEAAAEYFIIKIRRDLAKDKKPAATSWDNATFDAKKYVTARTSPVDKIRKALAGFTDEQLAALGLVKAKE